MRKVSEVNNLHINFKMNLEKILERVSIYDLARRSGISVVQIQKMRIRGGSRDPSLRVVWAIANAVYKDPLLLLKSDETMLEKKIEKKCADLAKKAGWLTYKFVSPSQRGVPDRIFIKDGRTVFVEFKALGKKPSQLQAQTIRKMQAQGCEVYVCDSVESFCDALSL